MEDSSAKPKNPSSRVIDSLHQQIDSLKDEVETLKTSSEDYKKKYTLAAKKNDSIVDQLANTKHENDMINALLKRKERRILDIEDQYNDLTSANDSLQLNNKSMKIRCENLQESSASSTAEFERLKIAYDALIASQVEYKRHYQKELNTLSVQFETYKVENQQRYEALSLKLSNNDKDVDTLLDSLTNKRKTMDNLYVNKNKTILELLTKLAKTAKLHGQESKNTLEDSVSIIQAIVLKHPDLQEKLSKHEKVEIDLDELLTESNDVLSTSFDEDVESVVSNDDDTPTRGHQKTPSLSRNSTIQTKKRKNKRNSLRFDSKSAPDFSMINTPTTPTQISLPKRPTIASQGVQLNYQQQQQQANRNGYYDNKPRTPTPPSTHNFTDNYELNPNYQYNQQYNQFNGQVAHSYTGSGNPNFGNLNNGNQRNFRSQSQNYGSNGQQQNYGSNGQHQLNQNMNNMNNNNNNNGQNNGGNKKLNRRSTYGSNQNNLFPKRNSQHFDPSMNLALNT